MNKVFIFLFLIALVFFQLDCAEKTADNSNQTNNVNAATTPAPPIEQANSNLSKVEETPVPTFTNADEALAAGKKLLDELETEKAVDALSQAVKLNPDLAEAHFNLGIAYSLIEKEEEKTAITQVETTPTPKTTKKGKKETVIRTKNSEKAFENAVKAYKKILAKNPKDDVAQFNLGRAYNKLNEDDDAMKALREAVKLKPDDSEYQVELGAIYMKLAQYDEAVTALKKANTLEPDTLPIQEMLEKAEAGKKRINFGVKPKLPQPTPEEQSKLPRTAPKPKASPEAKQEPAPEKKNTNQ
jgi:tetratricopeptide (TPR) repeat protein